MNAYSFFRRGFADRLEAAFLEADSGDRYTYADLERETARVASFLTGLGLARGDRVAAQIDKSPQGLFLYLGCIRAGFCFLPLNTAYQRGELGYFLQDAEPRVVVCRPQMLDTFAELGKSAASAPRLYALDENGVGTLADAVRSADRAFDDPALAERDLAVIIYTSGTTGRSKGAMVTHGNLTSNAAVLRDYWRFTAHDVLLHALPIFHTHGLFVATNVILLAGGSMIFLPGLDVDDLIRFMPQATTMMGVPTFYTRLLSDPRLDRELVGHMRLFVSGSAPLLAETHAEFEKRTGQRILERYGMTETGMIASNPLDGERRAGTVGLPLPDVEVRITSEKGDRLPSGETGNVEVRGPNVFQGYWRMPERTAQEFREDGFFITGDLGALEPDGYLRLAGRAKDLIISGGLNVYPKEIETLIDALPGVDESAVFAVPHPDFGEAVAAAVTLLPGASLDAQALLNALRPQLASFKVPKRIYILDELPRNAMSKVQKALLRERYAGAFGSESR